MKVLAIHDAQGSIDALAVHPSDAPPGFLRPPTGHTVSALVETLDLKVTPDDLASLDALGKRLPAYRIEPTAARLTKKY
jgi:hypothetical protein